MIRRATISDVRNCSELTLMAGKNEFRYFFPLGDKTILRLLEWFYNCKKVIFSKENFWVEEHNNTIRGAMLCVSGKVKKTMENSIGKLLSGITKITGIKGLLSIAGRGFLSRSFPKIAHNEFYINSISVYPQHRGQKVASALLEKAMDIAGEMHLRRLSLVVEIDNYTAIEVYKKRGFTIDKTIKFDQKYHKKNLFGFHKMILDI